MPNNMGIFNRLSSTAIFCTYFIFSTAFNIKQASHFSFFYFFANSRIVPGLPRHNISGAG